MSKTTTLGLMIAAASLLAGGCREDRAPNEMPISGGDNGGTSGGMDDGDDDGMDTGERLDLGGGDDGPVLPTGCNGDSDCELIDILFVIDNSATMGKEQLNLAANFPLLVDRLSNLDGDDGTIKADVNIMVTTSDFGHPLCSDFYKEDYVPSQGAPIFSGCNERIARFTGPQLYNPVEIPEACTNECPADVVMLGVLGVPPVTEREEQPPYAPTKGGIDDLVYRDWKDGEYDGTPDGGDILPAEWSKDVTAAHKQWEFGIGPGCTGKTTITVEDEDGNEVEQEVFTGQAVPPVRIREVCQSLDIVDDKTGDVRRRCCIESICDDDFSPAIDCLTGIIQETINPVG